MSSATVEVLAKHLSHGNSVLEEAIKSAAERGIRYGIDTYRDHPTMGRLWLVAGGPRNQTYWTEERIIKKNQHDPACTPAYLCDKCVDAILDAVDKPNKDEIINEIHAKAAERAAQ
jgi:hypothetical protein